MGQNPKGPCPGVLSDEGRFPALQCICAQKKILRECRQFLSFPFIRDFLSIHEISLRFHLPFMRPKLQYGEEAKLMSLNCMQVQFIFIPKKAQI